MNLDSPSITPSAINRKDTRFSECVVIIIPTYNEGNGIQKTLLALFEFIAKIQDFKVKVLVFDSASTDNTVQQVSALQKMYPDLLLQQEDKKTGLGSAYLQAMRYAIDVLKADIVFEFDADLSHQPKYIAPMLECIKSCDVVIGSRYVVGGSIPRNWGWHRQLLSILGNYVARALLTFKYKDFTSGFRASRCAVLKKILPRQFLSNHYAYKLELFWLLHKQNVNIFEYPIDFVDRTTGESKLPRNSIFDSLRVIFTLRYIEMKRYLKMCFVGFFGMMIQFIVYNLLRSHLPPFSAMQIAVLAAIINNFILNSRYTFKSVVTLKQSVKLRRWVRFITYSLMMIYLQSYWLTFAVYCFGSGALKENIFLVTGIGLSSLLNYFIYSRHIWPEYKITV